MSESGFKDWFEAQYDGLPDSVRLRQLKSELQSHLNAIQKLGSEQQELERLGQAWTDSLYGWLARGMKMAESLRDAEISRLRAENESLRVSAHNYTVAAKENEQLQVELFRDRANAAKLREALERIAYDECGVTDSLIERINAMEDCARAALAGSGNELADV